MELFWKTTAAVLLAVIMTMILRRGETAVVLAVAVCALGTMAAMEYLRPVKALWDALEELGSLDTDMIAVLAKAVGISLVTEIASMICCDSGNGSLASVLRLLGTTVVLWLSVPLFSALLELIRQILEGI